ncbi:hypothetical protein ABW19_dt0204287 [Dactylella cylindrospora]|nr:hypothetical protein ABW19_dt0204287 [Dactylella cylindrospora]
MSATLTSTAAAAATSGTRVADQTGIIGGMNPTHYNKSNPITLFIIQAFIIVVTCRLLHWPLSKIRQPRVIAEVIGGIILGPTVLGRVPGFTDAIFPADAMPNLNLVANLGLVLFLFLVGLEVDFRIMLDNWNVALSVGALGMILPFGLGAAISVGLFEHFGADEGVDKDAFPVLCRILTELKLLSTNVGVIVLAAGVGNDVTGWILLALTVALVNAGSGITALYVLLVATGYILFLFFIVKPALHWYLRRSGSLGSNGPTQGALTLTLLLCLGSAWFADVIGIHAIFGGFVVGLICPHEGGFAVAVAEKIEDLVTVLLLPLYFTLSGLRTNIGLLDSGLVWGYVVGVLAIAFIAKIAGGTIAAKLCKLRWRESLTIGALMSCKGLVELIVLNIGLTAGIISARVFTIFVVMALVTTFTTTPLTTFLYPDWYQKKCAAWRAGKINWDGSPASGTSDDEPEEKVKTSISRLTVLLRLDSLPSLIALITLLKGEKEALPPVLHKAKRGDPSEKTDEVSRVDTPGPKPERLEVHGLRLRELGERTSAVMRVAEEHEFAERDPVVNTFRAFGRLNNIACAAGLSIIPEDSFSGVLSDRAKDVHSDLLVVPWSETGQISDNYDQSLESKEHRFESSPYIHFMSNLLQDAACNLAIFINRGFGGVNRDRHDKTLTRRNSTVSGAISRVKTGIEDKATLPVLDPSHHVFFPFIGGADDRAALRFVLQLVKNTNVTATIVHIVRRSSAAPEASASDADKAISPVPVGPADPTASEEDAAFYMQIAESLPDDLAPRVVFETLETDQPIQTIITRAKQEVGTSLKNAGDLVVVGRTHIESYDSQLSSVTAETAPHVSAETRRVIGTVAESVLISQVRASVLVYKSF